MLAEPGGDYVAAAEHFRFCRCDGFGYRPGGLLGLRQSGWAVQHQYGVDFAIADQSRERVSIALPRCVADDVDGIAVAPRRRQYAAQLGDRVF
jgi:hypothetical protein